MQCKAIEEPNEPDEPEELRESRDGWPDERYREAKAGGHKYHRVSFGKKRREERSTKREEKGGRSEDTGGRRDERRCRPGERGGTKEGKRQSLDRITFPRPLRHALHTDPAPQRAPPTSPETEFA